MYQAINGWTKATMKAAIRANNNGSVAYIQDDDMRGCAYQSPSGNRCAVGCFIPNDDIDEASGHEEPVARLIRAMPHLVDALPLNLVGMSMLQDVHDLYPCEQDSGDESDLRDVLCAWIDTNVID